jgi:hypothetical protein
MIPADSPPSFDAQREETYATIGFVTATSVGTSQATAVLVSMTSSLP